MFGKFLNLVAFRISVAPWRPQDGFTEMQSFDLGPSFTMFLSILFVINISSFVSSEATKGQKDWSFARVRGDSATYSTGFLNILTKKALWNFLWLSFLHFFADHLFYDSPVTNRLLDKPFNQRRNDIKRKRDRN